MEAHSSVSSPLGDSAEDSIRRPLCVDLDGTLLNTEILWERVLALLRVRPGFAFLLPFWMLRGKERIRRELGDYVACDPAALPFRRDLLEMLRASADRGRRIVLCSASDTTLAHAVAAHLGFFDDVVSGDGGGNRRASMREILETRFAATGFDYVGGASADLSVLETAQRGYLVAVNRSGANRALGRGENVQVLSIRPSRLKAIVKVMRPHQWAKNALVVLPVVLAPGVPSLSHVTAALLAALAFSLCASAGYVFNDLLDVEADRAHRTKHRRPFASGDLPIVYGPPLFLVLLAVSFGIAFLSLPLAFVGMLAMYFVATLVYSSAFKSKLMVDVVVLAWLYTHRVLAGGIATDIPISAWLLAFSMFMFSSLAFAKRYVELRQSTAGGQLKSRGYHTSDLEMVASMGPTAGYMAVLVLCLYIDSNVVTERYREPILLWLIAPVLLYWISRVWFLAHRGQMQDDPVKFALTDWRSWVCAVFAVLVGAAARFWPF